jgi:PRTRC genetic system ThiF family protein
MEHGIHTHLLNQRVRVHLVGVGGNGAQMANCLARLDIAIRALGHPHGLHVTAYDDDRVSDANVGRQVYGPADIGQYKSLLTVQRLNHYFGLDWDAVPTRYDAAAQRQQQDEPNIVISCVDSASARRAIHDALFSGNRRPRYWLDLGNTESTAQVVLGETSGYRRDTREEWERLPCVTELFPQLLEAGTPEDDVPSCSVAISLAAQGLFVNDMGVRWASQLLYLLFSQGRLRHHGVVMNLQAMRAGPIDVDPEVWRRFGVKRRRPRPVASVTAETAGNGRGVRERARPGR